MTDKPALTPEQQRWLHDAMREDAQRVHQSLDEFALRSNEAAVNSGNIVLRAALLVNGGAAVSLLAFMNQLSLVQKAAVANTLLSFVWGIVFAVGGMGTVYFTHFFTGAHATSQTKDWLHPYIQLGPGTTRWKILALSAHIASVSLLILSIAFFVWGVSDVRNAIVNLR